MSDRPERIALRQEFARRAADALAFEVMTKIQHMIDEDITGEYDVEMDACSSEEGLPVIVVRSSPAGLEAIFNVIGDRIEVQNGGNSIRAVEIAFLPNTPKHKLN